MPSRRSVRVPLVCVSGASVWRPDLPTALFSAAGARSPRVHSNRMYADRRAALITCITLFHMRKY
eukprot:3731058-Prymnesium_polylepis.1